MLYIWNLYNIVYQLNPTKEKGKNFSKSSNSKRYNEKGYGTPKRTFLTFWFHWMTPDIATGKQQQQKTSVFILFLKHISSVQFSHSVMSDSVTPLQARQASLSITSSQSPPKPMSIELVMPSNYLILCCPLLFLPSIFPSIRVFSNESSLRIRWPKYWSFSFNISPSNKNPGLISFRMDFLDLLAVQGTLKSLLQHHSSKASILWCSLSL